MSDSLSSQEIRRLHRSLVGKLHDAIKYRRNLAARPSLHDPFGVAGDFADHLDVYGKHGDLSSRSRLPIQRVKFGGAWTYFCRPRSDAGGEPTSPSVRVSSTGFPVKSPG